MNDKIIWNKRCFIFEHVRPQDGCGNTFGIYNYDIWGGTEQTVFESLLRHYHNVILFHGHSHLKFYLQYGSDVANYDNIFGCHSIHIPSLAVPRDGDATGANSRKEMERNEIPGSQGEGGTRMDSGHCDPWHKYLVWELKWGKQGREMVERN